MTTLSELQSNSFQALIDKILYRFPALGKLLTSVFSLFEVAFLELFRRLDKKFNIYTFGKLNRYIMRGRWGGKVIPLNKNIEAETRFLPTQEILEILSRSNVAGISWCYCRSVQRKYNEPNCDHPLYTCIHLSFGQSLYEIPDKSINLKKVSKEKIVQLLEDSDKRGLIHQILYFPSPQFYYVICNCCPCCCVVMNKFLKYGSPQMVKSDFIAETDNLKCVNCEKCVEWCYFGARELKEGKLTFNSTNCFGCGICISKCDKDAIILKKK
jgi:Pyruvate/2-oxoacid:ferredoxin oxidoreductase delta subunit